MSMPSRDAPAPAAVDAEPVRTVLFSFLSRADVTPLGARSRAAGHVLDVNGEAMDDPAEGPAPLALEADPNLAFEHWGSYWRKVHGPRFTHAEDAGEEETLRKLLRYDQIHRVAGAPSSLDPMPYLPPVDAQGRLFDTVIGHVSPYRRPAWDGVAYLQFASLDDLRAVLGTERVRLKIGPEDRAAFRDLAPLLARRHVVWPNAVGSDAVTLVRTQVRRDGLDRDTFQRLWLGEHAGYMFAQPDVRALVSSYVQLHNVGPTEPGAAMFHPATAGVDGVTLLGFASMRDVERFLTSDGNARVAEAERKIARADAGNFWTGVNFTVVDRSDG